MGISNRLDRIEESLGEPSESKTVTIFYMSDGTVRLSRFGPELTPEEIKKLHEENDIILNVRFIGKGVKNGTN